MCMCHMCSECVQDGLGVCVTCVANAGEVDKLQAGGQCTAKPYASFTHVCTVTRYIAGVDYCCCSDVSQAMCCTYQQSFQQFRCIHSEDVIALT
jgi:hypothetical protein